uniref:Uncharacterized protein n=1 Tax=Tetranychus urticae TaxID=32264 RepID=T1JRH7_TETUR
MINTGDNSQSYNFQLQVQGNPSKVPSLLNEVNKGRKDQVK